VTAYRQLGSSGLSISVVGVGCNAFGTRIDEATTRAVVDAALDEGITFFDTADTYGRGASEELLGRAVGTRRADVVIATKFGSDMGGSNGPGWQARGSRRYVRRAVEASLRRLRTDWIDLYQIHQPDPLTPVAETLAALDELVKEGKVRHLAASNFTPERLDEAIATSEREGFAKYEVLQPHYNLLEREFESTLEPVAERRGMATAPYFGLAKGFLTGKYRPGHKVDSPRAAQIGDYETDRGWAVLDAVEEVAGAHDVPAGAVALAWLAAQPTVVTPIASARNTEQLAQILPMAGLELSDDELAKLTEAGA
jgi:aryl-alcohol dehydrogenase-like predicted oxidoreductase